MKAKKFIKALSGLVLLASFSTGFAMNVTCPSAKTIRDIGNKISYAYNTQDDLWVLVTDSFEQEGVSWQTIYTTALPMSSNDPVYAVEMGQALFDRSPLLEQPASVSSNGRTECTYTTADVNYKITVVTPAKFGIKKVK